MTLLKFFLREHALRPPYHIYVHCAEFVHAVLVPMLCPCNLFILAMPQRYSKKSETARIIQVACS